MKFLKPAMRRETFGMVKRKWIIAGAVGALVSTAAIAGYVQPAPITIDAVARFAGGDQVTARYSKNKVEFIGCGMRHISDGAGGIYTYGFCQASDAAGVQAFCSTEDAGLIAAMASSGDFGYISFSWNEAEECTRIGFSNQSFYLPKKLESN